MPLPRLPEPRPGEPVKAEHIAMLSRAIRETHIATVAGGLAVKHGPGGRALVLEGDGREVTLVKVVANIAAGTTSAPVKGTAHPMSFDGANYAVDTARSVDVYNRWSKQVNVNAQVVVAPMFGGYLFIIDPRDCGDLT